jgi:hypothetical protein
MNEPGLISGLTIGIVVIIFERIVSGITGYVQNKNKSELDTHVTLIKLGERFTILSDKVDSVVRIKEDYSTLFRRLERLEDKIQNQIDQ